MNERKLLDALSEFFGCHIKKDHDMSTLERWDSFKHLELMMMLEQEYGIDVDEKTILQAASVLGIKELLMERRLWQANSVTG